MTWIKICGTTNLEDALMSVEAGADALGFVFWEKSARNVDVQTANEIAKKLPAGIEKVGVFVEEPFERVQNLVGEGGLTGAQLHYIDPQDGRWSAGKFKQYFVLQTEESAMTDLSPLRPESWISALFLDSGTRTKPGGTGEKFDWGRNKQRADGLRDRGFNLVVAGGLTPENVGEAIRILNPWGVDVVSGVEASPGKKDPAKVRAFVKAVREASR